MRSKPQFWLVSLLLASATMMAVSAVAQEPKERTIDEIKAEAIHRAENGMYPLIGVDPADLREAFASIKTRDKDEWAAAFIEVGDQYMAEGNSLAATDPVKANADYIRAWRAYSFGRWPIPASPGKQRAYSKAIEAFLAHARFWDPPLQVVHIPFEGSEIIGYLRLPNNVKSPVPLVIAVNGLDSRKEDLSESFAAILPYGIGFFAVDGPGTGQAPIKVSETADRMLSRVIDYLQTRPEVDKNKIAMHGVSWGAYWATKMSIVERGRLQGASAQSPPVDKFFQKDFLMNSLLRNREYLFDQVPVLMNIFEGVKTIDDLASALASAERRSAKRLRRYARRGWLKPIRVAERSSPTELPRSSGSRSI
jgi:esterase FrsA